MKRAAPRRRAEPARGRSGRGSGSRHEPRERPAGGARRAVPASPPVIVEQIAPLSRQPVALEGPASPAAVQPSPDTRASWAEIGLWTLVIAAGLGALGASALGRGPEWLAGAGGVGIVTAYTWVLAARTGGRPVVFSTITCLVGAGSIWLGRAELRTGAAVVTAALAAVLAVVITVPAVRFRDAVRETCVAIGVAGIGGLAALGFEPPIDVTRFEYAVLVLALACVFTLVYRLGAGLHGLGRRGVFVVLVGGVVLLATLLYAEVLRRYGTPDLVTTLIHAVRWSREHLGAFPRPIEAALGVPALVWGTHMRARRRQGWWVCAFGVAGTAAVSGALVNPAISLVECALSIGYGLVIGLVLGFVIVRIDLALTGGRRSGVDRRGRRADEEARAIRPEPRRTAALL